MEANRLSNLLFYLEMWSDVPPDSALLLQIKSGNREIITVGQVAYVDIASTNSVTCELPALSAMSTKMAAEWL